MTAREKGEGMSNFQGMTVRHTKPMGTITRLIHYTMILCTAGLWIPVYLSQKRKHGER